MKKFYMHHTKTKGDIGVLKVSADLATKGFMILNPATEHAPFDIVIFDGKKFYRVQIKYRRLRKNGIMDLRLGTMWRYKKKLYKRKATKQYIDLAGIYCPQVDKCYYVPSRLFKKIKVLRVLETKNNQNSKVHWAKKFERVPVA